MTARSRRGRIAEKAAITCLVVLAAGVVACHGPTFEGTWGGTFLSGNCIPPGSPFSFTLTGHGPFYSVDCPISGGCDSVQAIQSGNALSVMAQSGSMMVGYGGTGSDYNGDGVMDAINDGEFAVTINMSLQCSQQFTATNGGGGGPY